MNNLAAMIITYNEEANISRTLSALAFLSHVLVIDSGSTDKTRGIVESFANTEIKHRDFDTFADQCNFGLNYLEAEWVLSLDADYIVTKKAESDIQDIVTNNSDLIDAYSFQFLYCIHGKPIRSALLPRRTCLYRRNKAHYVNVGHGHRVLIDGNTKSLDSFLMHDDQKSIDIWFRNQQSYQMSEALMLRNTSSRRLGMADLIRKHTCLMPFASFLLCMLKGGFLEGVYGLIYAYERLVAESLLYLYLHSTGEGEPNKGRHFKTLHNRLVKKDHDGL